MEPPSERSRILRNGYLELEWRERRVQMHLRLSVRQIEIEPAVLPGRASAFERDPSSVIRRSENLKTGKPRATVNAYDPETSLLRYRRRETR